MRVLVTGAAGFVGAHVVRALLGGGHDVAALLQPGVSTARLHDLEGRLMRVSGTLEEARALRPALVDYRPEVCIHLAWYAEPGKYLDAPENVSALTGSLALLEELAAAGCAHVVAVGSCAEYAAASKPFTEESPVRPDTLYAAAKLSLALTGERLAARRGFGFAWARLFLLYGPGEDPRRAIPSLMRSLLRGEFYAASAGEQVRDYLHVEDVASALVTLATRGATGVFNVCSGIPVTMRAVMETVGRIAGREDLIRFGERPYRDWEPMYLCGENGRLKAQGWTPRWSLPEGLRNTFEWWARSDDAGERRRG